MKLLKLKDKKVADRLQERLCRKRKMRRVWDVLKADRGYLEIGTRTPYLLAHFISTHITEEEMESYEVILVLRSEKRPFLLLCAMGEVKPFVESLPFEDVVGYFIEYSSEIMTDDLIKAVPAKSFEGDPQKLLKRLEELLTEEALQKHATTPKFLYNVYP